METMGNRGTSQIIIWEINQSNPEWRAFHWINDPASPPLPKEGLFMEET